MHLLVGLLHILFLVKTYKYAKLNVDKNKYFLIQEGDVD